MFHKFSWRHVLIVRLFLKTGFSYHWSQYWFHLFSHQKGSYLKYLEGKIRVSFILLGGKVPTDFPWFSPKRFRRCDPWSVTRQTTPASLTFSDTFASVSSLVASQALWDLRCVFSSNKSGYGSYLGPDHRLTCGFFVFTNDWNPFGWSKNWGAPWLGSCSKAATHVTSRHSIRFRNQGIHGISRLEVSMVVPLESSITRPGKHTKNCGKIHHF